MNRVIRNHRATMMKSMLRSTKELKHSNRVQHMSMQEQTKENVTLSSFLKRELLVHDKTKDREKHNVRKEKDI